MRSLTNKVLVGLLLTLSASGATTVFQTNKAQLGQGNSTNKDFIFNLGLGSGNPVLRANGGTNKLQFSNDGSSFSDIGTGSGGNLSVVSKTSNYTLTGTDDVILADSSGGTFTLTLPTAVGASGKVYRITKTTSDLTAITIATTGGQTIKGSSSRKLYTNGEVYDIVSDGSNWQILKHQTETGWIAGAALTYEAVGTVTNESTFYRREGNTVRIRIYLEVGTTTGSDVAIDPPASLPFDSSQYTAVVDKQKVGGGYKQTSTTINPIDGGQTVVVFYDGSTTSKFFVAENMQNHHYVHAVGNSLFNASGDGFNVEIEYPVVGWLQ